MENERQVTTEDAEKYAEENKMQFFEVSAPYGTNIDDLFEAIANACFNNDTIKKIKNEYIEDTKNEDPTKNENSILNVSQELHELENKKKNMQTPPPSKNKRCSCCPCNKDKEKEIKPPATTLSQLNNTLLN
jgi:Rab family protein